MGWRSARRVISPRTPMRAWRMPRSAMAATMPAITATAVQLFWENILQTDAGHRDLWPCPLYEGYGHDCRRLGYHSAFAAHIAGDKPLYSQRPQNSARLRRGGGGESDRDDTRFATRDPPGGQGG